MAGVEEGNAVFVPLFTIFAAKVLRTVFCGDLLGDFHLNVHNAPHALAGKVHETALFLKAEDFLDDGNGFRLIKKPEDGRLNLLHDVAPGHIARVHVGEEKCDMLPTFGLLKELEGCARNHA